MQDLTIALVQHNISWHQPQANRGALETKFNQLESHTQLIVLPEMFTTGFTMATKQMAEPVNGPTLAWMQQMAQKHQAIITGSFIVQLPQGFVNRLHWVQPNGTCQTYDKRHLFRMANEDTFFTPGTENPVFKLDDWRIKPLICYDLRFPVWSRNTSPHYDILLYVANWPQTRINAWDALLKARAIENLSYCLGVNRVGIDGTQKPYNGHSAVYSYKGEQLTPPTEQEEILTITLKKEDLDTYRKSFPAFLDADSFNITT